MKGHPIAAAIVGFLAAGLVVGLIADKAMENPEFLVGPGVIPDQMRLERQARIAGLSFTASIVTSIVAYYTFK